ncbi:dihydrofolate reductase family protein [Staphylococcus capitis]|uniref:dihydrofolate reductase family protein n=1 Tax=Staphylococcus capitis TaxID=29388 RepID=UPI000CD1E4B6|nr:dihydrofolate reductase family protein [Staphylococcus capitis]PNZ78266.1 dihydrofolate reductase [Staphylococcus capitis subsp. capitis]GGI37075.1 dihydrofolate reductase [Staphylococcus capitis]VTR12145.1 RibD C-terminal domain [Staphylococcus capitis]
MTKEVCAYLAVSVDGFIADKDESVQFLEEVKGEGDNGYSDFYNSVDVVVMGGRTFRWLINNGVEENPYQGKKVVVISSKVTDIDWDIEFYSGDLDELFNRFNNNEKIWIVGGGKLISTLINLKIITSLKLTIAPTILTQGVELLNSIDEKVKLHLRDVTQYNQFVELDYEII